MILDVFIKEGEHYKECKIVPPAGSDFSFFKSLRLTIEEQLDTIRKDIVKLYPENWNVSLVSPKIEDDDKQETIDKLVEFRTINIKTKELINNVLKGNEFIICPTCGGKMYRGPVNVAYTKVGTSFIIDSSNGNVDYSFTCEKCPYFIDEKIYRWQQDLKKQREQLIAEGKYFVPDELGFWHWINTEEIIVPVITKECRHISKRTVELYKIGPKDKQEVITKIQDKCIYCGEITYQK
jgi:hypothetical protein